MLIHISLFAFFDPPTFSGGTDNILKQYGARLGDLVIAYNAVNQKIVYAVINDIGPKDRLGEGSVLLNKLLLDKPNFPKT